MKEKDVIESFLQMYSSKNSIHVYKTALKRYFKALNVDPNKYFKEKRDYEADMKNFFIQIKDSPPKTIKTYLSAVKSFLAENEVDISEKFWRNLKNKINGSRALTMDRIPSNEELKSILTHMDAKGKALFLMLASSGMRIGEALQLKLNDIDLESEPAKVNISGKYTKTGNPRIAFISTEAKEVIKEWFKVRDDYIKAAAGKSHKYKKSVEDNRIFPFLNNTAWCMWKNAVKKAGLDETDKTTNRSKLHPHVLRKYFRTKMGAVIPVDIVEALMGHEGYLTEVYRRYSQEQLAEFYLKGEDSLTVFKDHNGLSKLRKEIEQRNETYDEIINRQAAEIKKLREKLAEMEQSKDKQLGEMLIRALENNPKIAKELTELLIKKVIEKNPEMGDISGK